MLLLVNKYGLSHICALPEFQNIGIDETSRLAYNFPYLDIYLSYDERQSFSNIEFYYRGAKDRRLELRNLFEHLLWTALNGLG